MFKHVGLSLCLCLLAMGLNSVFATQTSPPRNGAHSVTIGSNTHATTAVPIPPQKNGKVAP